MFAVGLVRGKPGAHDFELPKPEIKEPDEVLVRIKEVGIDGTDINRIGKGGDFAEGRNDIVMGHEAAGVVEETGKEVKSVAPGDPVTITVRRGCGICQPCLRNESDFCMTGLFTERGLHKRDGYLTQYVVDKEQYIVKVPPELRHVAVLTEPLSIAEKGLQQLRVIQSRMPWGCEHPEHSWDSRHWGGCKVALVVGAGSLGLLSTMLVRRAQAYAYVGDIVDEDHPKVKLLKSIGGNYVDVRGKTPEQIVAFCCTPKGVLDMIFEASGAARSALQLIPHMSRDSIYIMTGIPAKDVTIELDAGQVIRQLVEYNQVVVGSVNSNRKHFEMALQDMADLCSTYEGLFTHIMTHRFNLKDYSQALELHDPNLIKRVIEVDPW